MSEISCFKNHWKLNRNNFNFWRKKNVWFKVWFWSLNFTHHKLCITSYWSLNSCKFNELIDLNFQRLHRKIWLKMCSRTLFSNKVNKNDWLLMKSSFHHWIFELFNVFILISLSHLLNNNLFKLECSLYLMNILNASWRIFQSWEADHYIHCII